MKFIELLEYLFRVFIRILNHDYLKNLIAIKKYLDKVFNKELIIHPINILLLFFISTSLLKIKAGLLISTHEAAISFLIILALGIGAFFVIQRMNKNRIKASLILSYALFVTLFFRDMVEFITYLKITAVLNLVSIFIGELFFTITLIIILLAALILWLYKTKLKLLKLNSYLNLLTTIFLAVEIIGCGFLEISKVELKDKVELKQSFPKGVDSQNDTTRKPDIYFIILDGYTGFNSLQKHWNFDNRELEKFLTNYGFYVAKNGKSSYNISNYSIASTFNMAELNFEMANLYSKSSYLSLANLIKNNLVVKSFYDLGYDFINLSFFDILDKKKFYPDIYFLKKGNIYQARTIYGHLYEVFNENFADIANINLDIFNRLKTIQSIPDKRPKFIYAHIMMPHPPYYFDAEGNETDFSYANDTKNKHNYLEQLKFTNKLLMETLNTILNSAENPPIIVIQGDHGFREFESEDKNKIEFSVLNCYYLPDRNYSSLTDSSKTINTFRILFNKYFNQKLDLLN